MPATSSTAHRAPEWQRAIRRFRQQRTLADKFEHRDCHLTTVENCFLTTYLCRDIWARNKFSPPLPGFSPRHRGTVDVDITDFSGARVRAEALLKGRAALIPPYHSDGADYQQRYHAMRENW